MTACALFGGHFSCRQDEGERDVPFGAEVFFHDAFLIADSDRRLDFVTRKIVVVVVSAIAEAENSNPHRGSST